MLRAGLSICQQSRRHLHRPGTGHRGWSGLHSRYQPHRCVATARLHGDGQVPSPSLNSFAQGGCTCRAAYLRASSNRSRSQGGIRPPLHKLTVPGGESWHLGGQLSKQGCPGRDAPPSLPLGQACPWALTPAEYSPPLLQTSTQAGCFSIGST